MLLCRHNFSFYVDCSTSMIDMTFATEANIPIEGCSASKVFDFREIQCAPVGVQFRTPAFDITHSELVTTLISEKGMVCQPDPYKLRELSFSGSAK